MKLTLPLFILFLNSYLFSQVFEIEQAEFPFNDVLEWKGKGMMLVSSDPDKVSRQVSMTLVNDQKISVWEQKFTPKREHWYYITSENARYVYFLDNLQLENGKLLLNQLTSAGNIRPTTVLVGNAIKKIHKIDPNKLELTDVVVTDKALVHTFKYIDKNTKHLVEFATFTLHHNFLCYATILGKRPLSTLKDENIGNWNYIGFEGEEIYFANQNTLKTRTGWSVKSYTHKAKSLQDFFIEAPKNLISVEDIGFGATGKHYLTTEKTLEKGLLSFIHGKLYLVGGTRDGNGAQLGLFELQNNEWIEINHMKLNYFIEKKNLKLGIYPMNEGIAYHLDHNGYNKASIIHFDKNKTAPHNDFTEKTIFNPSSVLESTKKDEFRIVLPGFSLTFDLQQLKQPGSVKFELTKK